MLRKDTEMNQQTTMFQNASTAVDAAAEARALAIVTRAFETDPPVRWMYPEGDVYAEHFPQFVRALAGDTFRDATLRLGDGAAALWVQPGSEPDEDALAEIVERSVPAHRRQDVLDVFDAMGVHHPAEPHWYLPLIGVVPERQGRGSGTALMTPVLDICDRTGFPVYLEATTEDSRALYARLGFETTAVLRIADCPPLWTMVRKPR
jgi:GNAT superfamily N-acetyltransferase